MSNNITIEERNQFFMTEQQELNKQKLNFPKTQ